MKKKTFFILAIIVLNLSCSKDQVVEKNEQILIKDKEYFSGVSKRFEKSFINRKGLFFDDFESLPKHTGPKKHEGRENITRYSYHSVVEKDNWTPKNNSIEIIEEEINYINLSLSPKQLHKKIDGYRAELTLHNGNPNLEEEWYEWRFMIPRDYELDEGNIGREVSIIQYHYVISEWGKRLLKGPTINFTYLEQYDKNMLLLRYGIKGQDQSIYKGFDWKVVALDDTIKKGKWYTIRVNIKWSLTNQGYIAAWLNGNPFTPFNGIHNKVYGANLYNNIENTFKFGYYRYWDNSKSTSIYFDYILRTRSYEELTGENLSAEVLYGRHEDYLYLDEKNKPLKEIKLRKSN